MGSLIPLALVLQLSASQQPPDFSGRWTLVPEAAEAARGRGPRIPATSGSGWGQEFTVAQQTDRLIVERAQFSTYDMQPPVRFEYALDGSESRNVINIGRGPQAQTARASWKDSTLVISTQHGTDPSASAEVTQVFSLDSSGILRIDTTRMAKGAATPSTTTTRYRRMEEGR